MKQNILFTLGAWILLAWPMTTAADYYTEYVWYQALTNENRIVISIETLRGRDAVDRYEDQKSSLEAEGKYHTYDYKAGYKGKHRTINKIDHIDGHEVRTKIEIYYPRGNTRGGAVPNVYLEVYYDGIMRVECPIGFVHRYYLTIPRIEIHVDNGSGCAYATLMPDTVPSGVSPGQLTTLYFDGNSNYLTLRDGRLVEVSPDPAQDEME